MKQLLIVSLIALSTSAFADSKEQVCLEHSRGFGLAIMYKKWGYSEERIHQMEFGWNGLLNGSIVFKDSYRHIWSLPIIQAENYFYDLCIRDILK